MTSVIRKTTKNMKNSICAILVAVAAMPPNPKTAAMIEMVRNTSAQWRMETSS